MTFFWQVKSAGYKAGKCNGFIWHLWLTSPGSSGHLIAALNHGVDNITLREVCALKKSSFPQWKLSFFFPLSATEEIQVPKFTQLELQFSKVHSVYVENNRSSYQRECWAKGNFIIPSSSAGTAYISWFLQQGGLEFTVYIRHFLFQHVSCSWTNKPHEAQGALHGPENGNYFLSKLCQWL